MEKYMEKSEGRKSLNFSISGFVTVSGYTQIVPFGRNFE